MEYGTVTQGYPGPGPDVHGAAVESALAYNEQRHKTAEAAKAAEVALGLVAANAE